ncbi:MAG: hypothetical protein WAQ29_02495 [Nitrososphaeraceae archaeon]
MPIAIHNELKPEAFLGSEEQVEIFLEEFNLLDPSKFPSEEATL